MNSLVILLTLLLAGLCAADNHVCNCGFDRPVADEPDCAVFGSVPGSDDLIPWTRASVFCIQRANSTQAAVDLTRMWTLCPFPNGTNVPTNSLVSFIRTTDTPATASTLALLPNFFTLNPATGEYEFPDQILNMNFAPVDCSLSQNLCWNEVDTFLVFNETARNAVCGNLHDLQVASLQAEQASVRKKLCLGEVDEPACDELKEQVLQVVAETGATCDDVMLGPGNKALPDPMTCGEEGGGESVAPSQIYVDVVLGTAILSVLVTLLL